jgi:hypothetical protein
MMNDNMAKSHQLADPLREKRRSLTPKATSGYLNKDGKECNDKVSIAARERD